MEVFLPLPTIIIHTASCLCIPPLPSLSLLSSSALVICSAIHFPPLLLPCISCLLPFPLPCHSRSCHSRCSRHCPTYSSSTAFYRCLRMLLIVACLLSCCRLLPVCLDPPPPLAMTESRRMVITIISHWDNDDSQYYDDLLY